ncbi:uncharacterized protein LOC128323481 [Hemicordylus capensis]|uniref:uncharacterized protein LOC128323481 n=1 Tax=Hemicordylus capensis TaxID=884348 RepID=UPI0023021843|nr:uncharacterized protein LOC128323481 [Hemicordylus capensis]
MGGCWSWVNCRSHPEAEPKDEDEEGAQTGHPRNPAHVAPCPGGPTLHHILGDPLREEPNEATLVPGTLPGPHINHGILGEELNEATSVPGSLSGPLICTDILEETLKEETSMPGSLLGPHITDDILGEEVNEETSVPGPSIPTGTPKEEAFVSEPLPEPSTADNDLAQEIEILKGLQNDYVQRQMRVRRISQQFPRSLRAINLQIGHARTRLIRSEVRLQRWGKEGDQALMPVIQTASRDVPEGPATCLRTPGSSSSSSSASMEAGSIPPSASTSSFLLHPSPPPPPSPPPLEPDLSNVKETFQSLMDLQFHQLNDRQRDLRSCQECVQNIKALRGQLRRLRSRLARVEATMGILVPPRELDVEEEKEEDQNQQ